MCVTADRVRRLVLAMAPTPSGAESDDLWLVDDLGFDSLRLMELTVALERAFELPRQRPDQLAGVRRVGDVIAFVQRVRQAAEPVEGAP